MIWVILGIIAFISFGIFVANNAQTEFTKLYQKTKTIYLENETSVMTFLNQLQQDKKFSSVILTESEDELTDCYYQKLNCVKLSNDTITGSDLASFCIAAHEFGHAEQNLTKNKKYYFSQKLRKVTKILGHLAFPVGILGSLMLLLIPSYSFAGWTLIGLGALFLVLILLSNWLITLVEFDASNRAIALLQKYNILNKKETKKAKAFLRGAGYTYLGNFFSTLFSWTFLVPNPKII